MNKKITIEYLEALVNQLEIEKENGNHKAEYDLKAVLKAIEVIKG